MRGRRELNCGLPNMRLKLAGAIVLMEPLGRAWRARTFVRSSCADGLAARSLSAIR